MLVCFLCRNNKTSLMSLLFKLFIIISMFCKMNASAQTATEKEILHLSLDKFQWKTTGKFDLLADLFDEELVFVHLTGHITTKDDWINQLKTRRFVYNNI